jgi:uncharacterized protein (TIGR02444 family)
LVEQCPRDSDRGELQYDNEFWRFSLAVYEPSDVANECLALQEALGLDVNILLFCAWLGNRSIALSRSDIEAASRIVARWHDSVVRPLRSVRRQIKADYDEFANLRARVKEIELEAEQIEQAMLFAFAKDIQKSRAGTNQRDVIARNINEYIAMMSRDVPPKLSQLTVPFLVRAAQRLKS